MTRARAIGFVGLAHPQLGRSVFRQLRLPMGRYLFERYADGDSHLTVRTDVAGKTVVLMESGVPPANQTLMDLLILIDAIRSRRPKQLILVLPFVPYRRQEKQTEPGESLTLKLVGKLLRTAGVDELITVNLHRPRTAPWLADQVLHVSALDALLAAVRRTEKIDLVCAPDNGAIPLARDAAHQLQADWMWFEKLRLGPDQISIVPRGTGQVRGRRLLLIDDEIDTAGTITAAAKLMKRSGAKSISVAAVHAVLSPPSHARLRSIRFHRIYLSDTLPLPPQKRLSNMRVIQVAPLLTSILRRRLS